MNKLTDDQLRILEREFWVETGVVEQGQRETIFDYVGFAHAVIAASQEKMQHPTLLRYIGNIFLIVGYFFLLNIDMLTGLIIKCIGGILTLPFAIKYKLWDVVFICAFFGAIEISKIIELIKR